MRKNSYGPRWKSNRPPEPREPAPWAGLSPAPVTEDRARYLAAVDSLIGRTPRTVGRKAPFGAPYGLTEPVDAGLRRFLRA